MHEVKENLAQINSEINEHREKSNISTQPNVIAVTKYVTIERAKEAYQAGVRHFGENRLEGFKEKKKHYQKMLYFILLALYNLERLKMSSMMLIIFML